MKKLAFIIALPLIALGIHLTSQEIEIEKNSAFQLEATQCSIEREGDSCNGLIKFGVSKELYLNNDEYRKKIDSMTIEKIIDNSKKITMSTETIAKNAKFTLKFAEENNKNLDENEKQKLNDIINSSK